MEPAPRGSGARRAVIGPATRDRAGPRRALRGPWCPEASLSAAADAPGSAALRDVPPAPPDPDVVLRGTGRRRSAGAPRRVTPHPGRSVAPSARGPGLPAGWSTALPTGRWCHRPRGAGHRRRVVRAHSSPARKRAARTATPAPESSGRPLVGQRSPTCATLARQDFRTEPDSPPPTDARAGTCPAARHAAGHCRRSLRSLRVSPPAPLGPGGPLWRSP